MTTSIYRFCWRCGVAAWVDPMGLCCENCEPWSDEAEMRFIAKLRHAQYEEALKRAREELPIIKRKRHMPTWLLIMLLLGALGIVADWIYEVWIKSTRNNDDDDR
jgi:hypothetical protein